MKRTQKGFTLIELLIVIVIIGILAGVVLSVIDPAGQQRKARETVMRTNVEKACLALHACGQTTTSALNCDLASEIGIRAINNTPVGAFYYLTNNTDGTADAQAAAATDTMYLRGVLNTCVFECSYNFSTSTPAVLARDSGANTCLIDAQ